MTDKLFVVTAASAAAAAASSSCCSASSSFAAAASANSGATTPSKQRLCKRLAALMSVVQLLEDKCTHYCIVVRDNGERERERKTV